MGFPRIAHIITDLDGFGGTEATLLRYLKSSSFPRQHHKVIVLKSIGSGETLGAQMVAAGVPVSALGLTGGIISLGAIRRLHRELKSFEPDVISGWLYHPSLLSSMLAWLLPRRPRVIWHIRSLPFGSFMKSPGRFLVQRMLGLFSHVGNATIVTNSATAHRQHVAIGFASRPKEWTVISNGLDVSHYSPERSEGILARRELGIPDDALLIGCVGRFVPEKGYPIMMAALASALSKMAPEMVSRVHFLAAGNGVDSGNADFMALVPPDFAFSRLHLLGKRADIPRLLRMLDIFVLPSISEAFPNSLVEAMATGLPCIATDVGECARVLPDAEMIVPANDVSRMADRITMMVKIGAEEREAYGRRNRQRVIEQFTLEKMAAKFDALFQDVDVNDGRAAAGISKGQ